ncbi:unnamed protein product [Microthlaspi erraticum]|uniref:NB-ARC domain-containing protein n=1 Tax=Microthlaspi erraticum TaxID=1685480 RepID=A0A6D2L1P3_9BRAS|nr:unnamed protein product [Microthlaspi erraticum]
MIGIWGSSGIGKTTIAEFCSVVSLDTSKRYHLGAVRGKLKNMKVLIFIDDMDDQVVLETLVGGDEWFGPGSRIIVVTKDKQILRGHGIECVYEVGLPSEELALQISANAFRQNSPPMVSWSWLLKL